MLRTASSTTQLPSRALTPTVRTSGRPARSGTWVSTSGARIGGGRPEQCRDRCPAVRLGQRRPQTHGPHLRPDRGPHPRRGGRLDAAELYDITSVTTPVNGFGVGPGG